LYTGKLTRRRSGKKYSKRFNGLKYDKGEKEEEIVQKETKEGHPWYRGVGHSIGWGGKKSQKGVNQRSWRSAGRIQKHGPAVLLQQ